MTKGSTIATSQDGGHPAPAVVQIGTTHRVDTTPHSVQSTTPQPMLDRLPAVAELKQLPPRNHPVLTRRKRPCLLRSLNFAPHREYESALAEFCPPTQPAVCAVWAFRP